MKYTVHEHTVHALSTCVLSINYKPLLCEMLLQTVPFACESPPLSSVQDLMQNNEAIMLVSMQDIMGAEYIHTIYIYIYYTQCISSLCMVRYVST